MSVRLFVLSALTAVSALPGGLTAQERQRFPQPKVYIDRDGPEVIRDRIRTIMQRRARLGVTVDLSANETDSVGARIQAVSPGGPAAKAGIRSGDVITRINGKSLTAGDNTRTGEDESLPGVRLVEYASQLKPAETVTLEYLRAGVKKTAWLVTGDEPMVMEGFGDGGDEPRIFMRKLGGGEGENHFEFGGPGFNGFSYMFGGPMMDLELAPINADLGAYFGTTEGVLVINVPKESTLGLKAGDVILSVDSRKATNPGSFLRILRTYEPGETFKLEIMRNKSRTTVTGSVKKDREE
jgi:S1-C subfamily serine protease